MYGATEAGARLSYVPPDRLPDKIESIGIAIPDVTLRIVDKSGRELPTGQKGELVAQGPNIMLGYWRDPEATAGVLDESGYHTGDMGYRDAQGYFFLEGRKDNIMKVGGHRINPQEVEDALIATGLLLEVVVVGLADELLGNKLAALAVLKDHQCVPREILKRAAANLPKYKLPQTMHFVRALPKNSNGKIDKSRCCEKLRQLTAEA
jgi:acyl-CoA synthetase (AMP-forming)/AMP-acid ligase II